jgi:hypothetical protein
MSALFKKILLFLSHWSVIVYRMDSLSDVFKVIASRLASFLKNKESFKLFIYASVITQCNGK